ncbi:GIY-YIG nuclease family protein [Spirochaetota bacterium]
MENQYYYIYIIESQNGNYYTGYTNDLKKRYEKHISGKGAKFTRAFKPKKIVRAWKIFETRGNAMKVEALIKKQDRATKEELVKKPRLLSKIIKENLGVKLNIKTHKL